MFCAIQHTRTRVSHRQMNGDKLRHSAIKESFIAAYFVLRTSASWVHAEFVRNVVSDVVYDLVVTI
jgi:hypothetical protein